MLSHGDHPAAGGRRRGYNGGVVPAGLPVLLRQGCLLPNAMMGPGAAMLYVLELFKEPEEGVLEGRKEDLAPWMVSMGCRRCAQ